MTEPNPTQETRHAPVRWGIISTADIGIRALIPAVLAANNSRLVAIASRDAARASAVAARLEPQPRVHGSYEALLDDPEVEVVYIPLPNSQHAEWTMRAAAKGEHVLCEKPLALTADQARTMVEACRSANVLLLEAFM